MLNAIRQFVKEEEGASGVEYAILLGIMGAAVVLLITPLSAAIGTAISNATTAIDNANAS